MASTPVLVTQLTGQAWVRDADGNLTPLRQGMRIPADAEVVTASGSTVVLQADGQPPLVLGENQDVALSPDVFEDIPAAEAAVPTAVDPLVENLIAAINNGQDPLAELDPTAATNAGGGGGDHTFVRLASVLEATTPLALAYPRPTSDVVEDRLGGAAGTTLPPLYEGTLTLSAQQQVTEGGMIIVTATVDRAPRGSDLVITLRTGEVIVIRVGETSGSVEIPTRTDDAYVQGTDQHLFEVGSTTGGGYDRLDTTSTTSTNVVDDQDPTEIVLSADTQVTEGGKITVTATVDKAPQGSDLVITLKTGETITIKVGELTGSVLTDSRPDDGYLQGTQGQQFEIAQAEGGNYEALDTSSTTSTQVQDDADTVTVQLTATTSTTEDGGSITYTASLVDAAGKPVTTNNAITVTLANGEVITIAAGSASGESAPVAVNRDDVFLEADSISNHITSISEANAGTTGALEHLVADKTPVQTTITDDVDTVTVKLEATQSTSEDGGSITYTASLVDAAGKPVTTNNAITVTLANGEVITIAAGSASGVSDPVAVDRDDVFLEADSISNHIESISEANAGTTGALEHLEFDATPVQTTITDDADTVTVQLTATTSTTEDGGSITYTASLVDAAGKPVTTHNDITVTLANGEVITIAAGSASGVSDPVAVNRDDVYRETDSISNSIKTISEANAGKDGAFEKLVADTKSVSTAILDDSDPVYVQISVDQSAVFEGGALVYTVRLVDGNGDPVSVAAGKNVTVTLDWSGAAANGADVDSLPPTVTIAAGQTAAPSFTVTTLVDTQVEYREPLTATIAAVQDNGGSNKGFEDLQISATQSSVSSTVVDKPTLTVVDSNGAAIKGQVTVNEKGLTSTTDDSESAHGTLKVTAGSGLDSIKINGTTISLADLQDLGTDGIAITVAGHGVLTITGFTPTAAADGMDVAWDVQYTYTLTQAQTHAAGQGTNDALKNIALEVIAKGADGTGTVSTAGTLGVQVIDDVPTIVTGVGAAEPILTTDDADLQAGTPDKASMDFAAVFVVKSADYGADGAKGAVAWSYQLAVDNGADSGLKSGGQSILLYQKANGEIVGVTGGNATTGKVVFSVTVDATGKVTLVQTGAIDHDSKDSSDYSRDTQSLLDGLVKLSGTATITDKDGDKASHTTTVNIGANLVFTDDGPTIGSPTNAEVAEKNLATGTDANSALTVFTGSLAVDFGADNASGAKAYFTQATADQLQALGLSSNGTALVITLGADGKIIATAGVGGAEVFRLEITNASTNQAGYKFTLTGALDHVDGNGQQVNVLDLPISFEARDSDGDTASGNFQVSVVDDVERASQTITVTEDSGAGTADNKFSLGADVAASEIRILAADGVTVLQGTPGANGSTVYATGHGLQGTVTVNKDGSITYVPSANYSNQLQGKDQYAADELKYSIVRDDGSPVPGTVTVQVKAVADAPVLDKLAAATTNEDTAVHLGLKAPTTSDASDQNGTGAGDNPERLGPITLSGFPAGAQLLDANGNVVYTFTSGNAVSIVLTDGNHTTGSASTSGVLQMTTAEFEALQVLPPAENAANFKVTVKVTSYEVDESGNKLSSVDGKTGSTTVDVKVHAVTDPIELKIDGKDSHDLTVKEDSSVNLTPLLKVSLDTGADGNTQADVDGSEHRWLEVTGLPVGSTVNGTLITSTTQVVKVEITSKDASSLPDIIVTPPKDFSGDITGITVTLKAQDLDPNGAQENGVVLSDSVTLNLHVEPVAGDVVVEHPKAIAEDTEVAFLAGVRVTDSGTAGGTEVITKVQFELPQDWTLSGQPAAGTAGDAVWTVTGSGTTADPYVIEFTAGSEANRELALGQFTLTPPAHSSKDATVQLSITTVDSNADVTGGADTSDEVTVQKPVQITVTPVAESTAAGDTDHNGQADLTVPTTDHTYAALGKEDTVFNLNIEATDLLNQAGWKNEDQDETTTVLLTPVKLSEDGLGSSPAIGTVFTWNGGSATYQGTPIEVPLSALSSLTFQAPLNDAGTFQVQFQAKTYDYDDDTETGVADTAISDAGSLTIHVAPDADLAALSVQPAQGLEDTAIALTIRPSSTDGSETFNVSIAQIPAGASLHYGGLEITSSTTGVPGITVTSQGGSWSVVITDYQTSASLSVTPPVNSNVDFALEVKTQAVDALQGFDTSTGAWSQTQNLPVKVIGVADEASVAAKPHTYTEADLDSGAAKIQLGDLIQSVQQADTDGSEKLSFRITGLPEGFTLEGARYLGGTGADRVWAVDSEAALKAITITAPENFSGTVSVQVTPVTTENDGDWKSHATETLVATITPSPESVGNQHATLYEDRESALDFSIQTPQGENESLTHVHIKVEDFESQGFQLFLNGEPIDSASVKIVTDAQGNDWYVLDATQASQVTALPITENKADNQADAPELKLTVKYEVTDASSDGSVAPVTTLGEPQDYHLHVTPVTDQVSLELGGITTGGADLNTDTSGSVPLVTLESTGNFQVGIVLSSADQDGSESLIQVLVTGVPNGLTVDGLSIGGTQVGVAHQLDSGKWVIEVTQSQLAQFQASVQGGDVQAQLSFTAGSALSGQAHATIGIEVFSQDAGASNVSNASVQYELQADLTGGGQPGQAVQLDFARNPDFTGKEDTAFTLDQLFQATISDNPSGQDVAFTLSLKLPAGATIVQDGHTLTAIKVGGDGAEELWLISGTAKTTEELQALLSEVVVTPPADLNDHFGGMQIDATMAGHVVSTGEQTVVKVHDTLPLAPETDGVSTAVVLSAADADGSPTGDRPKEGSDIAIQIDIARGVDGPSLLNGTLTIKLTEGDGFSGGKLFYGTTELVQQADGSYQLPLDAATQQALLTGSSTSIVGLHYQPDAAQKYVNGSLEVEVTVQSKEQNAPDWTSSQGWADSNGDSGTVVVEQINNGFEFTNVGSNTPYKDGDIGTIQGSENQTGTSLITLDIAGKLLDADGSEQIHTAILENLPNGFLVYYTDANGALVQAINTGSSWSIPVDGGKLPVISIQAPQNWSGTVENLALRVLSGEGSDAAHQQVSSATFQLEVAARADGFETDTPVVEQSFGREGDIIALNLNLAMKDRQSAGTGDSSLETVTLTLTGLGEHASFYVGSTLHTASYDQATDTYTLTGLSQTDMDQLGFVQAKDALTGQNASANGLQIGFTAHTVDGSDVSSSISGSFDLTLSSQSGSGVVLDGSGSSHGNLIGGAGSDTLLGGAGDDVLRGGAGNDSLHGGAGNDHLEGGSGNDVLIGGAGNDTLIGGDGDDIFVWKQGDAGGEGLALAAKDVVADFGNGHDVLDLADLLQNENADNLGKYLSFSKEGEDTVLRISSTGAFSDDAGSLISKVDQQITLQGVDLLQGSSSEELVKQMLSDGRLKVDQT